MGTYKLNRRMYTEEGSRIGSKEIFYATFFTTAENAAKSYHTPCKYRLHQSSGLVLHIKAQKLSRSHRSGHYF